VDKHTCRYNDHKALHPYQALSNSTMTH